MEEVKAKCGIFFSRDDFTDQTGCLKNEAHNDFHVCKTDEDFFMAWEDDYSCKCGCWDEYDNGGEACILYWKVDDETKNQTGL